MENPEPVEQTEVQKEEYKTPKEKKVAQELSLIEWYGLMAHTSTRTQDDRIETLNKLRNISGVLNIETNTAYDLAVFHSQDFTSAVEFYDKEKADIQKNIKIDNEIAKYRDMTKGLIALLVHQYTELDNYYNVTTRLN